MEIEVGKIEALRAILEAKPGQNILLLAHTNPDGDALGSTLAMRRVLISKGHNVNIIAPNKYPSSLGSLPDIENILIYRNDELGVCSNLIKGADIIFALDFNTPTRLEDLGEEVIQGSSAKTVLIDHHLSPDESFDVILSYPEESSTCFVLFSVLVALYGVEVIDTTAAELLYVGMMTDTGNFSFAKLSPALYRAVASLAEKGIDIPAINNMVFNSYTLGRARLFGYTVNRKMKTLHNGAVSHMSLTEEEMRRFRFQQGDSEGFVNFPLTVKKMKVSALFVEQRKFIRVSLRSRRDVDVNLFARKYFNGGGHKNAAGGKSFMTMEQTIAHFEKSIVEYLNSCNKQ
ncbi:MAG: DHH family phosphoesterase [Rikenellaceae bacterium]